MTQTDQISLLRWTGAETLSGAARAVDAGQGCVLAACLSDPAAAPLLEDATLCPAERQRAERFRVSFAREEFVAARALLRAVLAPLLQTPAAAIRILAPINHKPHLATPAPLDFSLSHSGGWVAVAILPQGRIGVDLEQVRHRTGFDPARLARMVCTTDEIRWIDAIVEPARTEVFLDLWRRKEALLKAAGLGFSGDAKSVAVLAPDGVPLDLIPYADRDWRMVSLGGDRVPPVAVALSPGL